VGAALETGRAEIFQRRSRMIKDGGALAILAAPREVYFGGSTRLTLREWVSAGSTPAIVSASQPGVAVLEVRGVPRGHGCVRGGAFRRGLGAQGVMFSGWVGEGEELGLSTPEYIQLGVDTRLRFASWRELTAFRARS